MLRSLSLYNAHIPNAEESEMTAKAPRKVNFSPLLNVYKDTVFSCHRFLQTINLCVYFYAYFNKTVFFFKKKKEKKQRTVVKEMHCKN